MYTVSALIYCGILIHPTTCVRVCVCACTCGHQVTEEALNAAIAVCGPDAEFKKIGQAIHAMADKHSYGVVRKFIGHGVGSVFHAGPAVLHYREFCRSPFPHPSPTLTPPFPHPDPTLTPLRPHSDPTLTPLRPHSDPTLTPPFHAEFSPLPFPHPDPTIPC
ncbi:unnamed protein product [Closterium sp. NIES-54]